MTCAEPVSMISLLPKEDQVRALEVIYKSSMYMICTDLMSNFS